MMNRVRTLALVVLAAALATGGSFSALAADQLPQVTPQLRERSVGILCEVLNREHLWVKVHAAEYLLRLDYPDGVEDIFTRELELHGSEPQYRIGIWRVLGRAANSDAERAKWFGKIRDVLLSPNPPDRPHAAETLTKLCYRLRPDEVERVEQIAAKSEGDQMISYLVCLLVLADRPGAEARLVKLLDSNNAEIRLSAAYAIRYLPSISTSAREKLQAAAQSEPPDSPARIYMIQAVAMHSPANGDSSLKAELAEYTVNGIEDNKVDACQVLAQVADSSDLPLLVSLLDNSNQDVRSTAAYAILRIGRRVPHHLGRLGLGRDRLVFSWSENGTSVWQEFGRIQKAAGIELTCRERHIHTEACHVYGFHDLRRAFATMNAPRLKPEALQKLMRHKSYSTTLGYINTANQLEDAVKTMPVPPGLEKSEETKPEE